MSSFLLKIKDDSKMDVLLNFLKSLNYISVEKFGDTDIELSEEQKKVLDHRRATAKPEDFINWKTAKKQLKFKRR